MRRSTCLLLFAVLPVVGCAPLAVSPVPRLNAGDVPAGFGQATTAAPAWPAQDWWQNFGSNELAALETAVQGANLDIAQAEARLRQADARARQAGTALLPTVAVNGNVQNFSGANRDTSGSETDFAIGLGVSYEVDFWGRNRAGKDAAEARLRASVADRATVGLSVSAAVADGYFQLLALRERRKLIDDNLEPTQKVVDLLQRRVTAGYAANADLAQARADLALQKASLPMLEQQELEARTALAILLGRPSQGFTITADSLAGIAAPVVAPGLPGELLARRPDIVAAEANLLAAHADVTAARAAMLPNITLTADANLQYPALNAGVLTLSGTGIGLTLGGALTQAVFDGGRLQAKTAEIQAREQELLAGYRAAVLTAFADVDNALGNLAHLAAQEQALIDQVAQAEAVLRAAQRKYTAGSADYLLVTDARRSVHAARDQLIDVHRARLVASVMLFKALGGGWRTCDATPCQR